VRGADPKPALFLCRQELHLQSKTFQVTNSQIVCIWSVVQNVSRLVGVNIYELTSKFIRRANMNVAHDKENNKSYSDITRVSFITIILYDSYSEILNNLMLHECMLRLM